MFDEETRISYIFPPLCNRTEFNCMSGKYEPFKKYCPNIVENCEIFESYGWKDPFFCNNSKTCIPKGKFF